MSYWTIDGMQEGNPPEGWTFTTEEIEVIATYHVDAPAKFEEKIIKEYPNGGKDIELIVKEPQRAHWIYEIDGENVTNNYEGEEILYDYINNESITLIDYRKVWHPIKDQPIEEAPVEVTE